MFQIKYYIRNAAIITIILLLIICQDSASAGAHAGIDICLRTVIPALFPFFLITVWANGYIAQQKIPGFHILTRRLHVPAGGESLLLLGLIGGYPVGAQLIANAQKEKLLSKEQAHRMLGYCNNAGPAFIFGVTSFLFASKWISFLLWVVHIISSLTVGFLIRGRKQTDSIKFSVPTISFHFAMRKSITITATVCGWIIAFKALLSLLQPIIRTDTIRIFTNGFLEISGGCLALTQVESEAKRFILCAAFLAFGGICVLLQTASVTESLGLGLYIPGKIMQMAISVLLSTLLAKHIFADFTIPIIFQISEFLFLGLLIWTLRKYCIKKMWKLSHT